MCYADCQAERDSCVESGANPADCEATHEYCDDSCNYQYDTVWAPYWGRCAF
jgi:hypothetical protein